MYNLIVRCIRRLSFHEWQINKYKNITEENDNEIFIEKLIIF